jgi:WD40 repeat protein
MAPNSLANVILGKVPPPMQSKGPIPKHKFEGHEDVTWSFVFLHDNVHIVSGSWDGTLRKWDCETGRLVGQPWGAERGSIYALALSSSGRTIACGRDDGSVERWNTDGEMKGDVWNGHGSWVLSLTYSPSGGHLASGSGDGTILIRHAESGAVDVGPIETKQGSVWSLAYSPSGDRIASGGDCTLCIWDSNTGELLVGPIRHMGESVTSVVWSSDGSKLYSASDIFARVFDSISGGLLHRFKHDNWLNSIALSPKQNIIACVGGLGVAQLWNTESHLPLGQPPRREDGKILGCVSFSRDGKYLAYGSSDRQITLWMVEDITVQLLGSASRTTLQEGATEQETPPESPPSSESCLDVSTLTLCGCAPCSAYRTITGRCYKVFCTSGN